MLQLAADSLPPSLMLSVAPADGRLRVVRCFLRLAGRKRGGLRLGLPRLLALHSWAFDSKTSLRS